MARRVVIYGSELYHHGIKGQKWGIRRYQNEDGTLTEEGKKRYHYNSETGTIKRLQYPKNQILRRMMLTKINKENDDRWNAAQKTFKKEILDQVSYSVKDKESQRTFLEDLSTKPFAMAEISDLFARPGKFDSGERLEEKRALSKLSEESVKKYNACIKANLRCSKYSSEFYKKDRKEHPNEKEYNASYKRICKDPKYQELLNKMVVAEVKLINSQMKNVGLYPDEYSACLILGTWYKDRYDKYIKQK